MNFFHVVITLEAPGLPWTRLHRTHRPFSEKYLAWSGKPTKKRCPRKLKIHRQPLTTSQPRKWINNPHLPVPRIHMQPLNTSQPRKWINNPHLPVPRIHMQPLNTSQPRRANSMTFMIFWIFWASNNISVYIYRPCPKWRCWKETTSDLIGDSCI
jgi:hypothetical protein